HRRACADSARLGRGAQCRVVAGRGAGRGTFRLSVGGLVGGESMFHRVSDASKVAVIALAQHARAVGVELIDVQMPTPHLASLGALTISREQYLQRLAPAISRRVDFIGGRAEFSGEAVVSPVE